MPFFTSDPGSSAETNYKLTIIDEHEGGKVKILLFGIAPNHLPFQMYNLTFPGRHTVNQVKRDVATVTGIPVFRQVFYFSFCFCRLNNVPRITVNFDLPGMDRVA